MRYYYFRLSGSIDIEKNFSEEDITCDGRDGSTAVLSDKARQQFERELRDLLDDYGNVLHFGLTHIQFTQVQEEDD